MEERFWKGEGAEILRVKAVARRLGVSVPTVWRWAKSGRLPAPVEVGPGVTGWWSHEIDETLAGRPRRDYGAGAA